MHINHLKTTLDRLSGQWEFLFVGESFFNVRFLNTGRTYQVTYYDNRWHSLEYAGGQWVECDFLANRLNGRKRDDAGAIA